MTQTFNHTYLEVQNDTKKFNDTFLVQDDTKVLMAKHDVQMMLETTQKQQQQFSDIPDQLPLDPNIPITFTKVKACTFLRSCFLNRYRL